MRKIIVALTIGALLLAAFPIAAAAARGGHHGGVRSVSYAACARESCVEEGLHTHGSRTYTAHYYGDGHAYHDYCSLEDCDLSGYHEHDGAYCFGHAAKDEYRNRGTRGCCH